MLSHARALPRHVDLHQNESLSHGAAVTLTIRPEKVALARPEHFSPQPTLLAFRGTVRKAVYIGTDARYLLALPNQKTILARIQSSARHRPGEFAPKQAVLVCGEAADVRRLTS